MAYAFRNFEQFLAFVIERHRIYERRAAGQPAPWTKDPILRKYRFCNIYRELDRTTQWIAQHWRMPYANNEHIWFSIVLARLINHPDTLAELSPPGRWDRKKFLNVMHRRKLAGKKVFSAAYIISTGGKSMNKAEYLAKYVLDEMWDSRKAMAPRTGDSLFQFFYRLRTKNGMGSFLAAQVVADLKYIPPLNAASDWWTFAASGPGSRRGMSYLLGLDSRTHWKEQEWKTALDELAELVHPHLFEAHMPKMHEQDLQNCLCEYGKYVKAYFKTGKPKQKFVPYSE